jgi:phosphate starvation-inducible protein PhoH
MKTIQPLTENQKGFFDAYDESQIMLLHGIAGTGKTYIALYHALEEVLDKSSNFNKVVIVRSAVPSRDIGHLPGDEKEKTEVYTEPYIEICADLFERPDAYQRLSEQKAVQFLITSFVRGITLSNSIIIVDECQNITHTQTEMVIGRLGKGGKMVFCGDLSQVDLKSKKDSGIGFFTKLEDNVKGVKVTTLKTNHRHEIVEPILTVYSEYKDIS